MENGEVRACADSAAGKERNQLSAELYEEHGRGLHQFLLGLLRDRADADEALQQVFTKLIESPEVMRRETLKGWLYTVGYHEAMACRRRRHTSEAALGRLRGRPVWDAGVRSDDPATLVARVEDGRMVRRALVALPDRQREVVERRFFRDQTFATIAREIGCPLNTVLSRMRLALVKLKHLLEEYDEP